MRQIVLLGPQQPTPNVGAALEPLDKGAPVCVVTAGWQEREGETEELGDHLGRRTVDLSLYHLAEQVFRSDSVLAGAHKQRQDRLKDLQSVYRIRLSHALRAVHQLTQLDGASEILPPEIQSAIVAVRSLDRHHLKRIAQVHAEFQDSVRPLERPAVVQARGQISKALADSSALLIAGGHVIVLLNRLRLFDLLSLLGDKPIVAWSAGAMVLSDRIVLFHDSPPQGAGDAEVIEGGLGCMQRLTPLPHARRRLNLIDRRRTSLFARRFSPNLCVTLERGSRLDWAGGRWSASGDTLRLMPSGNLKPLETE